MGEIRDWFYNDKNDVVVFFKISPCKCSLSLIFFPFQIHAKILWQFSDFF